MSPCSRNDIIAVHCDGDYVSSWASREFLRLHAHNIISVLIFFLFFFGGHLRWKAAVAAVLRWPCY
jgi:hypothetical protein